MKLKRLLIVDDNDDFRSRLRTYLEKHNLGLEIFEANSGEMGVAKASCVRPNVVLMDINLPNSTGLAAAAEIKTDNPDCQVIILTMFNVGMFKEASKKIKVADFIGKSEFDERLVPSIKKCLAK